MINKPNKKLKIGDNIKIIAGKYKNQEGKILKIIHKKNHVIIQNINLKVKYIKPKQENDKGEIKKIEGYIHASNIIKIL
uniref:Large ribosomal subunit protein uL24c n=1 Tax=Halydictyon mirabile TaxID=189652 RepID=A0A4D6WU27_9FLOR|nr:ribosomal protein L24 [Halydictyon mirabile]